MTQLLLIRHGINDMVGQKKLAGRLPGVHLNDEGKAAGRSSWPNASVTCRSVRFIVVLWNVRRKRLHPLARVKALPVLVREGLSEVDYGDWTGQAIEESE